MASLERKFKFAVTFYIVLLALGGLVALATVRLGGGWPAFAGAAIVVFVLWFRWGVAHMSDTSE